MIQDDDDLLNLLGLHSRLSSIDFDPTDNLGPLETRLLDALSIRPIEPTTAAKKAGLTIVEANVAFTQLNLAQLAVSTEKGWARLGAT